MKKDFLSKILEGCTFVSFSLLIINVLYQIISRRFFPQFSVVWTEEMSRLLFVYSISFAAPIALKRRGYVNVEMFHHRLNAKVRKVLTIFIEILSVFLFAAVSYTGISFIQLGMRQKSVTLGHQMGYVYMSIVGACILITVYSVLHLVSLIKDNSKE